MGRPAWLQRTSSTGPGIGPSRLHHETAQTRALSDAPGCDAVAHCSGPCSVTVYERNDRFGGLLMYGIPNMKLEKGVVQRRIVRAPPHPQLTAHPVAIPIIEPRECAALTASSSQDLMEQCGIEFKAGVEIGTDISAQVRPALMHSCVHSRRTTHRTALRCEADTHFHAA